MLAAFSLVLALSHGAVAQACTVPNTLTNGTNADATQVMANFNALLSCIDSATTGSIAPPQRRNTYDQVSAIGSTTDSGTTYTYSSGTVRQARASSGNQINFVTGLQEETAVIQYSHREQTAAAVSGLGIGIGLDVTNSYSAAQNVFAGQTASPTSTGATAGIEVQATVGQHFVSANENSDGTNAGTFDQGQNNALTLSVRM